VGAPRRNEQLHAGMINYQRRRSGRSRQVETVLVGLVIAVYLAAAGVAIYWTIAKLHWNPVVVVIGYLVVSFYFANCVHKLMYTEDFGLHNLEGYDPETGTVPSLEEAGFDTSRFWPTAEHPKYRRH
jgi:hypothetical protein